MASEGRSGQHRIRAWRIAWLAIGLAFGGAGALRADPGREGDRGSRGAQGGTGGDNHPPGSYHKKIKLRSPVWYPLILDPAADSETVEVDVEIEGMTRTESVEGTGRYFVRLEWTVESDRHASRRHTMATERPVSNLQNLSVTTERMSLAWDGRYGNGQALQSGRHKSTLEAELIERGPKGAAATGTNETLAGWGFSTAAEFWSWCTEHWRECAETRWATAQQWTAWFFSEGRAGRASARGEFEVDRELQSDLIADDRERGCERAEEILRRAHRYSLGLLSLAIKEAAECENWKVTKELLELLDGVLRRPEGEDIALTPLFLARVVASLNYLGLRTDRDIDTIGPRYVALLDHPDPVLHAAVVEGLGDLRYLPAQAVLESRLEAAIEEEQATEILLLQRALAKMTGAGALPSGNRLSMTANPSTQPPCTDFAECPEWAGKLREELRRKLAGFHVINAEPPEGAAR